MIACYLCFCLAAVCWLAIALIDKSHDLLIDRGTARCVSKLEKATAAIQIHWLRSGHEGLAEQLAPLRQVCDATYCAVVLLDGTFGAHTDPTRISQRADEPVGDRSSSGDLSCIRFAAPDGRVLREYRAQLTSAKRPFGELRVAIEEPSWWATIHAAAMFIPIAILPPIASIGIGSVVLWRLTRPVAAIESNLQRIARTPVGAEIVVEPLRAVDAATIGWNRIADQIDRVKRHSDDQSLIRALGETVRQRNDGQYEQVLQRLSDGIALTDAAGRIAFANRAVAALLGNEVDADTLTGTSMDLQLLDLAESSGTNEFASPAAQCRPTVGELVKVSSGGERVLRVSRLPLGNDATQGHVWSLRDVTQHKLAQQTRDRFIDTATHELRTPLANIKAYAETLATAESIDGELQKEFCNIINCEVTRLSRFIDDLLSISSMEAGALTIDRQKVETERLFTEVLSKVQPQMQQKKISFEKRLPPKLPELQLDKDKIVAVLINILGNAAKYTPTGGRVSLNVKVEDDRLIACVQDSGVGIAAAELPKVFDKFFRSDDPRVQAETGSGLGLSLAQEVVRMHGGELTVESELNQGSTFTISIPLT